MKIVFTATGKSWDSQIDPRLGRAQFLLIYDTDAKSLNAIDNRETAEFSHGVGPITVKKIHDSGAEVVITGNGPGSKAVLVLQKTDIKIFTGAESLTVRQALNEYEQGNLNLFRY
ncbi:MAG: NifB/NifX family molybdenum-iron cluster-binding protein [Candidatus Kapaibacterium sp.]